MRVVLPFQALPPSDGTRRSDPILAVGSSVAADGGGIGALEVGERSAPADGAGTTEMYPGLRIVRTLAMFSIIGHHILWAPVIGVAFGVTSLQMVMCALQTRQLHARPLATVARRRFVRLILPWIMWSVIYGALVMFAAWRYEQPLTSRFHPNVWVTGTEFHLWFLPFAFIATIIVNRVHKATERLSHRTAILSFASAGVLIVLSTPALQQAIHPPVPYTYWLDSAGTLAFGMAIGRMLSITDREVRNRWFFAVLLFAVLPMLLGPRYVQVSPLYERYGFAFALVCAGFVLRCPDSKLLTLFAAFNMGVYLVHMLVLRVMGRVHLFDELGLGARLAVCYVLCLGVVGLIRRLRIPHLA